MNNLIKINEISIMIKFLHDNKFDTVYVEDLIDENINNLNINELHMLLVNDISQFFTLIIE